MTTANGWVRKQVGIAEYLADDRRNPLFLHGDSLQTLRTFPAACIDFCMTSPPYWGQRAYSGGGIGMEETPGEYVEHLLEIFAEARRVLKPSGSFWLNIG